ncbi:MAG: gamma-glutamyl-gamma-aminobutyrate hydrolase family protein [Tepidisphaeraceae bacterium]|jgi:putative glutamine amidotransferase
MARPLIGITLDAADKPGRYQLNHDYATSVEKARGIPFPLPYMMAPALIPEVLDRLGAVLLTGGNDMNPARYGQQWHPNAAQLDPQREQFEFALLAEIERRKLPVMGICLGCQVMNVHRGGSLHQFLPDVPRENALEHRPLDREWPRHPVRVDLDTGLGRIWEKPELSANTYHKQAIHELGRDLRVVATAPDGIIEAIEDPAFPLFAAVQWHPERLSDEPDHLAIFKLLVRHARDY